MSERTKESGGQPKPSNTGGVPGDWCDELLPRRPFKRRLLFGAIGAGLGTLAGLIGGAAPLDVLWFGAVAGFVVGFVGELAMLALARAMGI